MSERAWHHGKSWASIPKNWLSGGGLSPLWLKLYVEFEPCLQKIVGVKNRFLKNHWMHVTFGPFGRKIVRVGVGFYPLWCKIQLFWASFTKNCWSACEIMPKTGGAHNNFGPLSWKIARVCFIWCKFLAIYMENCVYGITGQFDEKLISPLEGKWQFTWKIVCMGSPANLMRNWFPHLKVNDNLHLGPFSWKIVGVHVR